MKKPSVENTYLQQVLEEQEEVARQLRKSRPRLPNNIEPPSNNIASDEEKPVISRGVEYRITGFWLWKSVIVPPNVYVIHTRRGQNQPLHLGMGISFNFNPLTDAFLIIPSAVQTILINANCICRERQGILVQAYVQWMIGDLQTAYWKLDFSDPEDPMGIVNLQLREQAEAAIKDKVATMSIDEVLSDKQPIIEELTHRLQLVAEGKQQDDNTSEGLGLKIVTVQIKDAVVSSTRLWENLQQPFRIEREKLARLATLESEKEISRRERENRVSNETEELRVESELSQLKAEQDRLKYNRDQEEQLRRKQIEEEASRRIIQEQNTTAQEQNQAQQNLKLQQLALEQELLLAEQKKVEQQIILDAIQAQQAKAKTEIQIELDNLQQLAQFNQQQRELTLLQQEQEIRNNLSQSYLEQLLIEKLPEIANNLPSPQEQRTTIITSEKDHSSFNNLLNFIASSLGLTRGLLPEKPSETESNQ
jgi:flotillin